MIWRLKHPWWLHLPNLASLAVCIAVPLLSRPWPPLLARYTRLDLAGPLAMLVSFLAFDVVECELWVRAEDGQKRFNRYLLFPSWICGFIAGMQFQVFWRLQLHVAFVYSFGGAAICLIGAAMLEWARRPIPSMPILPAGAAAGDELSAGRRWTYFTIERSRWINRVLISLSIAALTFLSFATGGPFRHVELKDLLLFVGLLVPVLFYSLVGTLRIQVNSERLILRGGLGFPLLRLNVAEISNITVETLNPMADFGGWGIRSRQGVRAYLFGGSRGISFERRDGKKYLIACREPERLAAILGAAAATVDSSKTEARG